MSKWNGRTSLILGMSLGLCILGGFLLGIDGVVNKVNSNSARNHVYIGGSVGGGGVGYTVHEFKRHGNCYELFERGSESFAIKVDCMVEVE